MYSLNIDNPNANDNHTWMLQHCLHSDTNHISHICGANENVYNNNAGYMLIQMYSLNSILNFGQHYAYSCDIIWLRKCLGYLVVSDGEKMLMNMRGCQKISVRFGTFQIISECKVPCMYTWLWETIIECLNYVWFPPTTASKCWWRQPIITNICNISGDNMFPKYS